MPGSVSAVQRLLACSAGMPHSDSQAIKSHISPCVALPKDIDRRPTVKTLRVVSQISLEVKHQIHLPVRNEMPFEIKPQAFLNSLNKVGTSGHPGHRSVKESCLYLPVLIAACGKACEPGGAGRAHTREILVKFHTMSQCYCLLVAPLHTNIGENFSTLSEALRKRKGPKFICFFFVCKILCRPQEEM